MTQYLLSVHHDGSDQYEPTDMQAVFDDVDRLNKELMTAGSWVFGGGLEPIETATTIDARGTDAVVTDGPFIETKEYLGGFWVVEAADLDAALAIAKDASAACRQPIEIRPFQGE